jgi:hypothetical protein
MEVGTCRLCGETKPLVKCSHIVPESFYKRMKKTNEHFWMLNNDESDEAFGKLTGRRFSQKGPYIGGILCVKCENDILGKLDGYAHQVLFDRNFFNCVQQLGTENRTVITKGVNSERLYKFFRSVLFRLAIADAMGTPGFGLAMDTRPELLETIRLEMLCLRHVDYNETPCEVLVLSDMSPDFYGRIGFVAGHGEVGVKHLVILVGRMLFKYHFNAERLPIEAVVRADIGLPRHVIVRGADDLLRSYFGSFITPSVVILSRN